MLLPSALPCDRTTASQGMVSPPASPPKLSSPATFNIASSCFSLQSLIANTTSEPHQPQLRNHAQQQLQQSYFGGALPQPLPTPPMAHAPSPMRLRLRIPRGSSSSSSSSSTEEAAAPRGIVKRTAPPRHKRTLSSTTSESTDRETTPEPPSTPPRSRIAPASMPLGLERADFHSLQQQQAPPHENTNDWTAEDDRILVELVLEKLKLSKAEWQDCARTLGKDRHALSRRWKSLVMDDEVGLKRRKIHSTWR
ncbi:hypothetical protein LMH87_012134 [Akanthomyces muscarius]|uniref:Myb-like domain-containing protein n=1 Tax=Akanthomyces muscarius TaxID=2231603 RepID=A0A9W8QD74_AKAMU|nr:hypothetical protein LMH87_012134 [Akanthomyces muscarius]KAJ4151433.1 hypothetical protein LMH87_012134 [Akanthomyces muscarius]